MATMEMIERVNRTLPAENMYGHTKKLRYILEHVQRRRESLGRTIRLLDFGCGNGSAVSQFLMVEGVDYYGVDIHEPSREYAERNFGGEQARFLPSVPRDVQFDVLVYSDVLEHLDDPSGLLRHNDGVLAEDGLLVGCVPNGYGPFENEKRLDSWFKLSAILDLPARIGRNLSKPADAPQAAEAIPYNWESGHLQFYTRRSLTRTLLDGGYRLDDFRNGAFIGAPMSDRYIFRGGERISCWNARVADHLPAWAVSTWLFTATRNP
jgi:2-polyprenyl-3-methyl-5-hydroxy-6-metoxy-1,4-benzoquinol methylase